MADRSFAGFRYQQRLGVGFFGELFRALDGSGQEVRILHIDPAVATLPGFAEALARHGSELGRLEHEHVVGTRLVGKIPSGVFVVISEALAGPVALADVLADVRQAHRTLPAEAAWAVGRAVVAGLARAHAAGIVHGGVHPRSVLVDQHGGVRLGDFGVARALAAVSAHVEQPRLYQGYRGYLAPELALGEEPGPHADVFAAGALLHALVTGEPPPGPLAAPRDLVNVLRRAIATDAEARFADAGELLGALDGALAAAGLSGRAGAQLAAFLADLRGAAEAHLDAGTDDLLADLAGEPARDDPTAPVEVGEAALDAATADLVADLGPIAAPPAPVEIDHALAALHAESDEPTDIRDAQEPTTIRRPKRETRPGLPLGPKPAPPALHHDEEQPTHVDDPVLADDPLADLVATVTEGIAPPPRPVRLGTTDEDTPLPPPTPHHSVEGSLTRTGEEVLKRVGPRPSDSDPDLPPPPKTVFERPASPVAAPPQPAPVRVRAAAPLMVDPMMPISLPEPPRRGGGLWMATTLIALAGLLLFLYTQTDVFHPARARAKREAALREREAEQKRIDDAVPRSGSVLIEASEPEAAVWLALGRTPVDSLPLQAGGVHQIRLEHEGFAPRDLEVAAAQWTGAGEQMRAAVSAELAAAAPGVEPPALPPPPQATPSQQPGRGVIHIESTPPGAQAWLLVGFTPGVELSGVLAGAAYEFKVTKAGFAPGYIVIRAEEWRDGGGALRKTVSGSTELTASAAPVPPGRRP